MLIVVGWIYLDSFGGGGENLGNPNCARAKSDPNPFPRYMRRAPEIQYGSRAASHSPKSITYSHAAANQATDWRTIGRGWAILAGSIRAAGLYCAA